jgi:hypothetical protein
MQCRGPQRCEWGRVCQDSTARTVQYSTVTVYSTLKKHSTLQHSEVECSTYPHTSPLQTPLSHFLPPFVSLPPLLSSNPLHFLPPFVSLPPLSSSNHLEAFPFPSHPLSISPSPSLPAPLTYFTGDAGRHPLKHRQNTANARHSPTSPSTIDCSMVVTTDLTIVLTGQYVP